MFGLGNGKQAYPSVYTVVQVEKSPKKDSPSPPLQEQTSSFDSLEPAIDGPPSPERIRAYTEQMKRSSIFGNNSRTNTLSSATSSFRSRESNTTSTDSSSLSRKSSARSNSSSMPSSRPNRPDSVQIFGRTLFSRRGRRTKDDKNVLGASGTVGGDMDEEGLTKIQSHGQGRSSRRGTMTSSIIPPSSHDQRTRHLISGPYNFQHVTHTSQDHLPNLERSSQMELASKFTALRVSQPPTRGELKGIRAQDLHFENFSSEALGASLSAEPTGRPHSSSRRQRGVPQKPVAPPQPQRSVVYAKSHDNFRSPPPPRPPRSPMSPTCPVAPPARTSSRTASVLFDTFDPLATTTIDRPETTGGFRRPAPFGPTPPPPPRWSEQEQYFSARPASRAMTISENEAWPLTASPSSNFGAELADVQEEEEEAAKRRSRMSTSSGELRASQSVPALRLRTYSQPDGPVTLTASTAVATLDHAEPQRPPLSPGFQMSEDSWDNAIDYAYEHEAEADCDYQWDRCSVDDDSATIGGNPSTYVEPPALDLHLDDDHRSAYHGRFRPSLLIPSALDIPALSPMSNTSTTSPDPHTPSNFLRPNHVRSPSHASSFKESHGFTLSPSLLIPSDFKSQMEEDAIYEEHLHDQATSASIFVQESYTISPIDESISSTASYRSSDFSRGSARSSSTSRISGTNSRGSQDSMMLLSRAASISQAHRSIGSASSLPDLIPSTLRKSELNAHDTDLLPNDGALALEKIEGDAAPAPEATGLSMAPQHAINRSLPYDQGLRKGVNFSTPLPTLPKESEHVNLSPVAESFIEGLSTAGPAHGRKVSAPVLSQSVKEYKGRARAATTAGGTGKKSRGSYMLFPQV